MVPSITQASSGRRRTLGSRRTRSARSARDNDSKSPLPGQTILSFATLAVLTTASGVEAQDTTPPFAFIQPRPTLTLCTPNTFQWTGGTPPFTLQIRIPSGQVSVLAELPFTNISVRHFAWTPDIEGSDIVAMLFDSSDATTTSPTFSVHSTGNTTCSRAHFQKDTAPIVMVDPGAKSKSTLAPVVIGVAVAAAIVLAAALALCYWLCIAQRNRKGFKRVEIDDWELLSEPESPSDVTRKGVLYDGDQGPTIVVTSPSIAPSISECAMHEKQDRQYSGVDQRAQAFILENEDEDEDVPLFRLAPAHSAEHASQDVIFNADVPEKGNDRGCS